MKKAGNTLVGISAALAALIYVGGCEVRVAGPVPPAPPPPPEGVAYVDITGDDGYVHHGYWDHDHHWHGGWYDGHHVYHADRDDWHHGDWHDHH